MTESVQSSSNPNVLCIEDDYINWLVFDLRMRHACTIDHARNSSDALALINTRRYDLILMDIELANSDLNGIELTKLLRGMPPFPAQGDIVTKVKDIPIIFVTAYYALYETDDLIAVGGTDLVTKPIDFRELAAKIERCNPTLAGKFRSLYDFD